MEAKKFTKTAKQVQATDLMSEKLYTLLEGGSRSGKTFILFRNKIARALGKKSKHLALRKYLSSIIKSAWNETIPDVLNICYPQFKEGVHYILNKTFYYVEFRNGSRIWLGGMDDKKRIDKILGTEYSTILLNEASEFSFDEFETAKSRLAENSGLRLKFWIDQNPPSKKHWTYQIFHKGVNPEDKRPFPEEEKIKYGYLSMNPNDNRPNLPKTYFEILDGMGKRKKARFRDGQYASDIEGALWDHDMINSAHLREDDLEDWFGEPQMTVVGLDPNVAEDKKPGEEFTADEAGIVVVSKNTKLRGHEGRSLVEADYSGEHGVTGWAKKAVWAYQYHAADCIVAEVNQGGELVKKMIHTIDSKVPVKKVRATKGKYTRAEPIAEIYEQGRAKHKGDLDKLEDEMLEYVPGITKSPNRMDAMVWAQSYLFSGGQAEIPSIRVR